jgi:hypothetical protein
MENTYLQTKFQENRKRKREIQTCERSNYEQHYVMRTKRSKDFF